MPDTHTADVRVLNDIFRMVETDGRIRGYWNVVLDPERGTAWITPHEVVMGYGPHGAEIYSNAFAALVAEDEVNIGHVYEHASDIRAFMGELKDLLQRIAAAAWADTQ